MDTSVKRAGTAFRVCLRCVLVAALLGGSGCATQSYRDRQWDDVTGRQRDRAALDADYEKCRAVHEQAFLRSEGASTGSIDWAAQAGSDTAFLSCVERGGWKPRRGAAR